MGRDAGGRRGGAREGAWHSTEPSISFAMKGFQEGRCFFVDFIFPLGRFIKNHQSKLSTYWAEEVCREREGRCRDGHVEVLIRGIHGRKLVPAETQDGIRTEGIGDERIMKILLNQV